MRAHPLFDKLDARIQKINSVVCVGLDPDMVSVPFSITGAFQTDEEALYAFLTQIIDITAPHTCAYKLQKAFYDQLPDGYNLLKKTVRYIHTRYPDIIALIDCKLCDTDNTMAAYMHLIFDLVEADGVVVNPYVGDSVMKPFMHDTKKVGLVLIKSGNPGSKIVQDIILANGKKLWEELLHLTVSKWNRNRNFMVILAPTPDGSDYAMLRGIIPQDMPILMPGICVQNGGTDGMKALLNVDKRGVLVNFARGILYPYTRDYAHWQQAVLNKIVFLKEQLNRIRFS
jgi:orotidine-5'-phosphate decarboxylase